MAQRRSVRPLAGRHSIGHGPSPPRQNPGRIVQQLSVSSQVVAAIPARGRQSGMVRGRVVPPRRIHRDQPDQALEVCDIPVGRGGRATTVVCRDSGPHRAVGNSAAVADHCSRGVVERTPSSPTVTLYRPPFGDVRMSPSRPFICTAGVLPERSIDIPSDPTRVRLPLE